MTNIILFATLGIAQGEFAVGVVCVLFTSILPMALILGKKRRGSVGNHHVTDRSQRGPIFAGIMLCLTLLIGILTALGASRVLWCAVLAAVGFIALFAAVTVVGKKKISVHVGLWLTVMVYLAVIVSPWWWLAAAFTPIVSWARTKISHHTLQETIGGGLAGAVVAAVALVFV